MKKKFIIYYTEVIKTRNCISIEAESIEEAKDIWDDGDYKLSDSEEVNKDYIEKEIIEIIEEEE